MLSYFRVENYKCLQRVEFPLTPIHVLIGPNDSGKTSVLEAMRAYMLSTHLHIQVRDTLPEGWVGNELLFHGAGNDGKVSLAALSDSSSDPNAALSGNGPLRHRVGYGFRCLFARAPTAPSAMNV